jgi:hypothetical protein
VEIHGHVSLWTQHPIDLFPAANEKNDACEKELNKDQYSLLPDNIITEALRWTDPPTKESYQMSVDREIH